MFLLFLSNSHESEYLQHAFSVAERWTMLCCSAFTPIFLSLYFGFVSLSLRYCVRIYFAGQQISIVYDWKFIRVKSVSSVLSNVLITVLSSMRRFSWPPSQPFIPYNLSIYFHSYGTIKMVCFVHLCAYMRRRIQMIILCVSVRVRR